MAVDGGQCIIRIEKDISDHGDEPPDKMLLPISHRGFTYAQVRLLHSEPCSKFSGTNLETELPNHYIRCDCRLRANGSGNSTRRRLPERRGRGRSSRTLCRPPRGHWSGRRLHRGTSRCEKACGGAGRTTSSTPFGEANHMTAVSGPVGHHRWRHPGCVILAACELSLSAQGLHSERNTIRNG